MIQPKIIKITPSPDYHYNDGDMIGEPAQFPLSPYSNANLAADMLVSAVAAMNTDNAPGVVLYFFDRALDPKEFGDTRPFAPDYETLDGHLGQVILWSRRETIGVSEVSVSEEFSLNQPLHARSGTVFIYAVYCLLDVDNDAQPAPMSITLCVEFEVKR